MELPGFRNFLSSQFYKLNRLGPVSRVFEISIENHDAPCEGCFILQKRDLS
jgi:hypothetical protein